MNYFLTHRISAYMLFAAFFIFGVISCEKLPVSLMPGVNNPGISVIIEYPGVSPDKIEEIITKPSEKIIKTVEGIARMNSVSEEGKATINVEFVPGTDARIGALKVREKIGLIRGNFPREVQEPMVIRYDPSDRPVLIATVEKKGMTQAELREAVERKIKPILQRIEGVSEIFIAGGLLREIHIDVDRGGIEGRALAFRDMSPLVSGGNVSMPAGILHTGSVDYLVTAACRYRSTDDIGNTIVMQGGSGSAIRLADIASVSDSFREPDDIARLDGKERVTVYIHKAGDANTLSVCREAARLLADNRFVDTTIVYNQGDYISASIQNVLVSGLWGICIVVFVLALFIRRGVTVFALSLSIPVSLVSVFAVLYFLGVDMNVMSLSGLALGAGMVVDNGVVVTDMVYRNELINTSTIYRAVSLVKRAIVSSTLATIFVFVPILFGDISMRQSYGDLAIAVSAALAISLATAIILVPVIYAEEAERGRLFPRTGTIHLPEKIIRWKDRIVYAAERWEARIVDEYLRFLDEAFGNRKKVFIIAGVAAAIACVLFLTLKSEMVDPMAAREFYVFLEFPTGTTLGRTDEAVKRAEGYIRSLKIAEQVTTKVEKWRGTLTVKFNDSVSSMPGQRDAKNRVKRGLNGLMRLYSGFAFISEADEITSRELDIHFIGDDTTVLKDLAKQAAQKIQGIGGVDECVLRFREGRPEYVLTVDRDKAGTAGLSPAEIADFFRYALYGPVVTKFIDRDREVDVRMRFQEDERKGIEDVLAYRIKNAAGDLVPVAEVVTLTEGEGATRIWRRNGRRSVAITAKLGDITFDEAAERIQSTLSGMPFPSEYTYQFDESLTTMREQRRMMTLAVLAAILLDYMLLASLFESLALPLVIMLTIPLAFIGVVLALFVTGSTLNVSVYIGLIVLVGIVLNNGIILASEINRRYNEGIITAQNLVDSIRDVCRERIRPVLITATCTMMGMAPLLVSGGEGSGLWRPLSLTVISGLFFSTALTLIMVPLASYYVFLYKMKHATSIQPEPKVRRHKQINPRLKEKRA